MKLEDQDRKPNVRILRSFRKKNRKCNEENHRDNQEEFPLLKDINLYIERAHCQSISLHNFSILGTKRRSYKLSKRMNWTQHGKKKISVVLLEARR